MLTQPCAEAILLPIKDNQWNEETTFPLDSAVIISVGVIYKIQIDAVFDFAGIFLRNKLIERLLRMPFNSFCMLRELRQEQKDTAINKRRI